VAGRKIDAIWCWSINAERVTAVKK